MYVYMYITLYTYGYMMEFWSQQAILTIVLIMGAKVFLEKGSILCIYIHMYIYTHM